jgi:sigma-B regulation protein RsbU (phosphoserine phosphatase)
VHGNLIFLIVGKGTGIIAQEYFMNFINISFIFGIISIWISKKISFVHTPTTAKKANRKLYRIVFACLLIISLLSIATTFIVFDTNIIFGLIGLIGILLFFYLTKPIEFKLTPTRSSSISQRITTIFLLTTLLIAIFGILISFYIGDSAHIINMDLLDQFFPLMPLLIISNMIMVIFFIPGFAILRYIEKNVTEPISSFSEIEEFIHQNEKIESEGLVNIYSRYITDKTEIGTLARSYTDLINFNNNYIENIEEIEGEKKRIETELDIANKIQAENLPTEAIETSEYIVNGYSKPAKEVGGDFFDYYHIDDDNLAIVIGDASGKGVPAAILAMISQILIKQMLKPDTSPSRILYQLNNQLCQNNSENMFITLWIGIYNRTTQKLTFSNAGHNPPLIKENDKFDYLNIDSGIVLGIMEDYEFINEEIQLNDEIVLYTDGITDANDLNDEMYGEARLLNFFNEFKKDEDPINPLLNDISGFTKEQKQFDDMTLLYLKIK